VAAEGMLGRDMAGNEMFLLISKHSDDWCMTGCLLQCQVVDPEHRVVFLDTDACPQMAETMAAETVRTHDDLSRVDRPTSRLVSGCVCQLHCNQLVLPKR
jgi:hypothetical protein